MTLAKSHCTDVVERLIERHVLAHAQQTMLVDRPVTDAQLAVVQSTQLLAQYAQPAALAHVLDAPTLALLPADWLDDLCLRAHRMATSAFIVAVGVALRRGWAVSLAGIGGTGSALAFDAHRGVGCAPRGTPYASLLLAMRFARQHVDGFARVLVIDLQPRQCADLGRDIAGAQQATEPLVALIDVFVDRGDVDDEARRGCKVSSALPVDCSSSEYLAACNDALVEAGALVRREARPHLIVYLWGDGGERALPNVERGALLTRDERVFHFARAIDVPIVATHVFSAQSQAATLAAAVADACALMSMAEHGVR